MDTEKKEEKEQNKEAAPTLEPKDENLNKINKRK